MPSLRRWTLGAFLVGAAVLTGTVFWRDAQGQKMSEIRFELGRNIVETAEASGVHQFSARDIQGYVSYGVDGIPPDVAVRYAKPGYEINWQPVFAFTMYADREIHPDLSVLTATLQMKHQTDMNDTRAQAFVEATIAQFQKGKWQRYADPEWQVLLTGRSSILDASGQVGGDLMAIDPSYKMSPQEWREVSASSHGGIWRWLGDGVLAQLTVRNSIGADGKDWYDIDLDFKLLEAQRKRDAINLARDLKEGDAKGWNSTAEHEVNKHKVAELNKLLKANAIKRGDAVLEIPLN